jgi:hypothetical protein
MAVHYDESVIVREAELLYKQARGLAQRTAFAYGLVGAIFGAFAMVVATVGNDSSVQMGGETVIIAAVIFGVIAGLAGWSSGQTKGRKLRLEAQSALCQVAIERNTRPPRAG